MQTEQNQNQNETKVQTFGTAGRPLGEATIQRAGDRIEYKGTAYFRTPFLGKNTHTGEVMRRFEALEERDGEVWMNEAGTSLWTM